MKEISKYALILMCCIALYACKKPEQAEQNIVKVCIAFDNSDKNQKYG